MKAKNSGPISSETDAKEKLIAYVYEYILHTGAKRAAQTFLEEIHYDKEIQCNSDAPGFLANWWCVFWDLYCAAPEKRSQPEPSSEAKAFHDFNIQRSSIMSPQTSPPQGGPTFMGPSGQMPMGGPPRYGPPPPHPGPQMRGGGQPHMGVGLPRMQTMSQPLPPPPQMGVPPPHGPPPQHPSMMGSANSPRYSSHPGHMTPGSSASSGPMGPEPGPSPGLANRMTPNHSGSPHPQVGGPPQGGMQPMGVPPQNQPPMSQGPPPSMQQRANSVGMQPQGGGWQGNQFNVNSPADQQCFMPGPPTGSSGQPVDGFASMMMNDGTGPGPNNNAPNNQQDEYVMPGPYGQQSDQSDANSEIMKLKESLENNTNEGDQSGFNMDFPESQPKWCS